MTTIFANKEAGVAFLFFFLMLPLASATITIDSFSCNSQFTTASVETGETMNCNAVILNNDLQNAVSVNQVSLAVSGGWAEESTYAVSLNTNIGAGQSSTVTFPNIRATTSGSSHRFLHIDIDGTAHTEGVDGLAVNAVALKSLSSSASSSSVATSGSFDITSTIITGGSYSDVTLALSLSGGCALAGNDVSSKSIGSMGNNGQASRSWSVTQGSSSCTATVTATGTATPVVSTKTKSATVTNPTGGDSSSSSSSGGTGGAGSSNATANATAPPATVATPTETVSTPAGSQTNAGALATAAPPSAGIVPPLSISGLGDLLGPLLAVLMIVMVLVAIWFLRK